MPNLNDMREYYYEEFCEEYGEGDYAMGMAEDAAREDHQRMLAMEEQQRDLIDRDNDIRFEDGLITDRSDSHDLALQMTTLGAPVGSSAALAGLVVFGVVLTGVVVGRLDSRKELREEEQSVNHQVDEPQVADLKEAQTELEARDEPPNHYRSEREERKLTSTAIGICLGIPSW